MTAVLTHPLLGWVVWGGFALALAATFDWFGRRAELRDERQERDEGRARLRAETWAALK